VPAAVQSRQHQRKACGRLGRIRQVTLASVVVGSIAFTGIGVAAQDGEAAARESNPAAAVSDIEAGDQAYRLRRDPAQAAAALGHYRAAFALAPDDAQVAWRVGMAAYFMGIRNSPTPALKQKLWAEGRDAARRGAEIDPSCAPCHFWTAINMALYGESVGVLKMLFTLKTVRRHLQRSIELDPVYSYCGAARVQGVIDRRLPGMLGGSKQRARQRFEQAIQDCPDEPLNYLFLAELLEHDLHDRARAVQTARQGLAVPSPTGERVESIDCQPKLRHLLERLGAAPDSEPTANLARSSGGG
jgi:tetratricopeptide (TPR) repeat protein